MGIQGATHTHSPRQSGAAIGTERPERGNSQRPGGRPPRRSGAERTSRPGPLGGSGGIGIGRWLGVQVRADWSLLIIFGLITANLGFGAWPAVHPEWSAALVWTMAVTAAVLFFLTVLLHELAHAVTARAFGVEVRSIVLFLFGGMSMMRSRPRSAGAELAIAAAGPAVSALIGFGSLVALTWSLDAPLDPQNPQSSMALFTPAQTLLAWLGPINLLLAVFNLIPGFPLDGGRVLRAVLWYATGDVRRATRWATAAGRMVAMAFMACGLVMALGVRIPVFGVGLGPGLWLLLIGWFLYAAARASYAQLVMQQELSTVHVADLMREHPSEIDPEMTLDNVVHDCVLGSEQDAFPVVEQGKVVGLLTLQHIRTVPRSEHAKTHARDAMEHASDLDTVEPSENASTALELLTETDRDELVVLREGTLAGLLRKSDVLRYLSIAGD